MYILHFTTGLFYTFVDSHQLRETCHTWLSFCNTVFYHPTGAMFIINFS